MEEIQKCKKCDLPIKEYPGIEEWCGCQVGVDITEEGEPLDECRYHGMYSGYYCPGCEEVDRQIDEWKERNHKSHTGGQL